MKISKHLTSRLAIILCTTFTLSAFAQQQPYEYPPTLLDELKQLQKATLASDYAYQQLAHLTNNIGPRLSGSLQAQAAVEYVAAEMRKAGCEVTLEKVMVPHWVRGIETGELVQFPGQAAKTTQKIVLTALGGSVATPAEGLTAEVIVVENFAQLKALGRDKVQGKIVLFNAIFDERLAAQGEAGVAYGQAVAYRGGGASAAARLGAVAALNRSAGTGGMRMPHTGALNYAPDAPQIPAAAVTAEDADLLAYLSAQGNVQMHLTLTPQTLPDAESYNVIADLKGTEHPEQIIIVSGHLDSWDLGTGAIDDGAGVVVAMAVVNAIKQLGLKPRRTIRVIAWMNEENGLRGGRTYAKDYAAQTANHLAAIESDLGAGHPIGFTGHVSANTLTMLQPLAQVLRSQGASIVRRVDESPGADISPLDALGVPTFAPMQDSRTYFHYHHTPGDTLDKVKPQELAENAALMTVLAYTIANLPEALSR
ncbi:MAG: M20/M25/M40 family metallo-hydrolase [Acidobacteria bacterium]|nr:M20/M25/M40 family metallo-hydrolase [Acidobacteriota bacterium]